MITNSDRFFLQIPLAISFFFFWIFVDFRRPEYFAEFLKLFCDNSFMTLICDRSVEVIQTWRRGNFRPEVLNTGTTTLNLDKKLLTLYGKYLFVSKFVSIFGPSVLEDFQSVLSHNEWSFLKQFVWKWKLHFWY